jgi:tellurite resistance protein TerC
VKTLTQAKRIVIGLMGGTVLLIGIALIVLPGPAFLVIPAGLAILATEFAWAKRWLDKIKGLMQRRAAKNETAVGAPSDRP